jgi:hypothetical protein
MPLKKSNRKSGPAHNKAVSANMAILTNENKNRSEPRSRKQMIAIAISAATPKKYRKK